MDLRQELQNHAFAEQTPESFLVYADYLEECGDHARAEAARLTASVIQKRSPNVCFVNLLSTDRGEVLELLNSVLGTEFQLSERQREVLVAVAENPGASTAGLAKNLRVHSCSQTSLRDVLSRVQSKGLLQQRVRTRANGSVCERKWFLTARGIFLFMLVSKMCQH